MQLNGITLIARNQVFFIACKRVQGKFSACQRVQNGVTGYSVHLYSDKAPCFNQSERALYRNVIIKDNDLRSLRADV